MTTAPNNYWPAGKRCAVLISVLFSDGRDAVAQAPDLPQRSKSFSVWQYGALRGVDRLLQTFADFTIPASWFVPGLVAQQHPQRIRDIVAANQQLASLGWDFEAYTTLDVATTHTLLTQSKSVLEQVSGHAVQGFRLPSGRWPRRFDVALQTAGYTWSASLNGDDMPYSHHSGLVEIPVHSELDDRPYFQFNFTPAFPPGHSRLPDYDAVLSNWLLEFAAYRRYGGCFVLQLHPEWMGTPGRNQLLRDFLHEITRHDDVWLANGDAIAAWHAAHAQPLPTTHPLNVYEVYRQERGRQDA